jgi:NADP-dependent aldehyde dehydrogenase
MDIMQAERGITFIGGGEIYRGAAAFHGINPATGAPLEPAFGEAGPAEIEQACALAEAAFDIYRDSSPADRAAFLETIATNILNLGDELIETAIAESGLPRGRIEGERGRTIGQLRMFAAFIRGGDWLDLRIDPAQPNRVPLPRPDLRLRNIPIGPVAVFGASNFPLAFSVAGGDTASALAAGCPVVVKAHPAHPGTSALVGQAIADAVAASGLPAGVFSLMFGAGNALGAALVADARIKAVGFTGSRNGGLALVRIAAERAEPIPVYAEMSSINPVILFPGALAKRGTEMAKGFVSSLTMGAGQFCTNPGIIIAEAGPDLDSFIEAARVALDSSAASTMLTSGIFQTYRRGVARLEANEKVVELAHGKSGDGVNRCEAKLFLTSAEDFSNDLTLSEEIFGAASLVVRCKDGAAVRRVLEHLDGQLTVTLQMEESDLAAARALLPLIERKAGRLLVNGWPTGVEVCHAMVHGGPFPATSDSRTSSVGTLAIRRFLRPVCYQDFPASLLPEVLGDANKFALPRMMDGDRT